MTNRRVNALTGFTLLELLMVVIVIAILVAIAIPQYLKAVEKARAADAINYLGALRSAQSRYHAQNASNQYTNVLTNLDIDLPATLTNWGVPSLSSPATTGMASFTRAAGLYNGQTVGISYGTGTLCGSFIPLQPLPTCTAD